MSSLRALVGFVADPQPAPAPATWVDAALPLFRAILTLGHDATEDLIPLADDVRTEAVGVLDEAKHKLRELAETMRDDWIAAHGSRVGPCATVADLLAADAYDDALREDTPTVTDAMRRAKAMVLAEVLR